MFVKRKIVLSTGHGSFEPNAQYQNLLRKKGYKHWSQLEARMDTEIIDFLESKMKPEYKEHRIALVGKHDYQYVAIREVDISKYWTIEDYDNAEYIRYVSFEVVNKEVNYVQWK